MENGDDHFGDADFEQRVRRAAYLLWESEGCQPGREKEYWYRALEKMLRRRREDELANRGLIDPM